MALLGVSHSSIERVIKTTCDFNIATKLTGAGGGGCTLSLINPKLDKEVLKKVERKLRDDGMDCYFTVMGGKGVQVHEDLNGVVLEGGALFCLDI